MTPSSTHPILLVGATGTVGGKVAAALADRPGVRALARSDQAAAQLRAVGIADIVRGDVGDRAALDALMAGGGRLLLITPYSEGQDVLELGALEAAVAAGVEHVVKLSVSKIPADVPIFARHARVEEALAAAPLTATVLQPEHFMDNLLFQLDALADGTVVQTAPPEAPLAHVDARDIADVATHALTAPEAPAGAFHLTGRERLTAAQLAAELGAALGRDVTAVTPDKDAWAAGARAAGTPEWMIVDALGAWDLVVTVPREVSDAVPTLLGRPARPVSAFAREVLAPALSVTA
ncbi:NAD(P)H azoreductase [Baekduia alba]|uniref:NmrA family NAD(P)-binding protein n=1 Tax=Baekduia alba TaxID=2997333 RepID=UPI002341D07A|nr:NmrA family NAD(P)-binding protein [Baekduia alba]WCB96780.1 NAD(P)H azoreductase [Baekduia alba]